MAKQIALVGDPTAMGTIVQSPIVGVTINGKPVAVLQSLASHPNGPDIIKDVIPGIKINGKPVAFTTGATAKGAPIIGTGMSAGISGATHIGTPEAPWIKDISTDTVAENNQSNTSATNGTENNSTADSTTEEEEEEDVREVSLISTYPLDEFKKFAEQLGAATFSYGMQGIFGDDIPMYAFDYLYRDLSDNKVEMPEIYVEKRSMAGKAMYVKEENKICVSRAIIVKAAEEGDVEALADVYMALMEEFGHFIDWQLRSHYTCLRSDNPKDEGAVFGYCLTTLNFFEETALNFGQAVIDGTTYELKMDLAEIQSEMNRLVSQERIKMDAQDETGEYFGAGVKTFEELGGYTHYGIEEILLKKDIIKTKEDLKHIYLGNLLRDWSQLITPSTERYSDDEKQKIISSLNLSPQEQKDFFGLEFANPIKLSRKYLSFVIELIAAHELIGDDLTPNKKIGSGIGDSLVENATNPKEAANTASSAVSTSASINKWIKDKSIDLGISVLQYSLEYYLFTKHYPQLDPSIIGVYKSEEHMDNPMEACVVDLIKNEYLMWPMSVDPDINNEYGTKNYIRAKEDVITQRGVKCNGKGLPTSASYITKELKKSNELYHQGKINEAYMHLGNALHTIEDYFAHSNFVELCLIKRGYSKVIPWIEREDKKTQKFDKQERKTALFDTREEEEDYFDHDSYITSYDSWEELKEDQKSPIEVVLYSQDYYLFEMDDHTYQYIDRGERKGELHVMPGAIVILDKKRGGHYLSHLPIVTGRFSSLDMIHSLSHKLEDMFELHTFNWTDLISSEWEGKPLVRIIDLVILSILTDLKYAQDTEKQKDPKYQGADYSRIIEFYEKIITFRGVVFGILEKFKKGKGMAAVVAWAMIAGLNSMEKLLMNVVKQVMKTIIHGLATGIKEYQNIQKLGTNPTHSQLAKDEKDHPLHQLSGELARIAVADICTQLEKAYHGKIGINSVTELAKEYLSHPQDVHWMDNTITKWAVKNIGNVEDAQNKGVLDKFQKAHQHAIEKIGKTKVEFIEELNKELDLLKDFFEKTQDHIDDLKIIENSQKNLNSAKDFLENEIMKPITEQYDEWFGDDDGHNH